MRKWYILLAVLCLLLPLNASAQRMPRLWDEPPIKGVSRAWLRQFYFYQQRTLPLNQLPPNFWLDAQLQAEQLPIVEPSAPRFGIQSFDSWEAMGPDSTDTDWLARVNAIVVDRTNSATLYVGAAKGGVWKSTDSGTTWTNLTDTITQYVGCLVQDPVNANTFYLGTGEEYYAATNALTGVGIYKSTDGGVTWTLKGNSVFAGLSINYIAVDPTNTNKWVVSSSGGIYTTTDGGSNFTLRQAGPFTALRMHPTNSSILYAAAGYPYYNSDASTNGVFKSTDGGVSWTRLAGGLPSSANKYGRVELDIHRANPNIVYVAIGNYTAPYALGYLGRSTDGGANWTSLPLPAFSGRGNSSWYALVLRADPVSATTAYVGLLDLWRTTNAGAGATWTSLQVDHPDIHALEFDPNNSSNLYMGQDAGLYTSTNQGTNWTKKNTGRTTMEFYAFDVHPTDPQKLIAGAQDNGIQVRTSSNTFSTPEFGDGQWVAYKKSDPSIVVADKQNGSIYRSTNGGTSWSSVFSVPNGSWTTPIVNDPTTPSRFYTGGRAVYRSTDDGATWSSISGTLDNFGIRRIQVAPSSSNTLYVGTFQGFFFASTDGGATWVDRSLGLPGNFASVGAIAVDPNNANTVYVGISGYTTNRVWKSTNAGATWTNYMGNLPNSPVNGLVVNPVDSQLLAAMDAGVFVTSDGTNWSRYGSGLPNTPCTQMIANPTTGYLTVSTFGRGMFRILLPGFNPAPILTSITPNTAVQGSAQLTLTLNGDNFVRTSTVRWNGVDRNTTYVNVNQLTATIPASDLTTPGTANVAVYNPSPMGGISAPKTFTITALGTTFSGDTTGAPTYNRTNEGNPPTTLSSTGTSVPFLIFQVNVSLPGNYNFNINSNYDAFSALYITSFNPYPPQGPLSNVIVANDDKGGSSSQTGFDGVQLAPFSDYYLVVSGYSNINFGTFNGTAAGPGSVTITPLRYVKGKVTLQGIPQSAYPSQVTFQAHLIGFDTVNRQVPLASDGSYAIVNLLNRPYNISLKLNKWLRHTDPRDLTNGNVSGGDFTLLVGDANNDNAVDIGDLLVLISAYNSVSPSAGYNAAADFNGDNANDIADLLLLIANYNRVGDSP